MVIAGTRSEEHGLECNVPHGSVLGLRFICDTSSPVRDIFHKHGIPFHLYAEDTQVYITFYPSEEQEMLGKLEKCISEVKSWIARNCLKVNVFRTYCIILGKQSNLNKLSVSYITIGDEEIPCSKSVKNIDATFDANLSLDKQVSNVYNSTWFNLHQISKI